MANPKNKNEENVEANNGPVFEITGKCTFSGEEKESQFTHICVIDGNMAKAIDNIPEESRSLVLYSVFYTLKIQTQTGMRNGKILALKEGKDYTVKDAQKFSLENRLKIGSNLDPVKRKEKRMAQARTLSVEEMLELGFVPVEKAQ